MKLLFLGFMSPPVNNPPDSAEALSQAPTAKPEAVSNAAPLATPTGGGSTATTAASPPDLDAYAAGPDPHNPRTPNDGSEGNSSGDLSVGASSVTPHRGAKKTGLKRMMSPEQHYAARQAFLSSVERDKKTAATRRPSEDVGRQLGEHMETARKVRPCGGACRIILVEMVEI